MQMYLGQILMFAGNFEIRDYKNCDGQLMAISQNTALFSLLGTTYGGDGRTTFGLPDMRGRAPVHAGSGSGLTPRNLGQRYGVETVALNQQHLAPHNHSATFTPSGQGGGTLQVSQADGENSQPGEGNFLAAATGEEGGAKIYRSNAPSPTRVNLGGLNVTGGGGDVTVNNTGNGQPFDLQGPRAVVNFQMVVLGGLFPPRN